MPEIDPAAKIAEIKKLFETWPGWRSFDDDYDPNDLLAEIAKVVGEPLE